MYSEGFQQDSNPDLDYFQDSAILGDIKKCENTPVTKSIMNSCHGQKQCNLTAEPQVMGVEVCNELYVFLKTTYACVVKEVLKEEIVDMKRKSNKEYNALDKNSKVTIAPTDLINKTEAYSIGNEEIGNKENTVNESMYDTSIPTVQDVQKSSSESPHLSKFTPTKVEPNINSKDVDTSTTAHNNLTVNSLSEIQQTSSNASPSIQEAEILSDLSTREWSVLSDNLNLDILPLEQDISRMSKEDQSNHQLTNYIKVNN